jgi:diguanylate cyclase (GGDEF)-like protein
MAQEKSSEAPRTRSGESPSEERSLVGGWLERLRRPFANRIDTEHEVALWRVALLAGAIVVFVLRSESLFAGVFKPTTLVTLAALGAAVALLAQVVRAPVVSPRRRFASILLDQSYVSLMLFLLGEAGAWFLPLYLMVSVGNSLRYGHVYGSVASLAGAAGFFAVITLDHDFWDEHAQFWKVSLLTMVIVPVYAGMLGDRLKTLSQQYRQRAKRMQKAAFEDALTGLANRAFFRKHMDRAMERARGVDNPEGFAILYCDLDGFKGVNDAHGHHAGDLLLKAVARTLQSCVRGSDVVARLGGDEFGILLKGIRDAEIAKRIGTNIVRQVKAIDRVDGRAVNISCSVGITLVAAPIDEHEGTERILSRADEAMYQAKRAGKNQFYLQWASP